MTPRQENSIERSVGRIEAQLETVAAHLDKVSAKLDAADEWRLQVRERLEKMEAHGVHMTAVADAFEALQLSIRDSKMQVKGMIIGVGVAAGAGGATIATGLKWLWATLMGA